MIERHGVNGTIADHVFFTEPYRVAEVMSKRRD
jgi:hypothetical protein